MTQHVDVKAPDKLRINPISEQENAKAYPIKE